MDKKYLLPDLVELLSSEGGIKKKEAEDFLKFYFSIIEDNLLNDKVVKINDLGTFKLIEAEARASIDVNTGQSFLIKEHYKLSFLPDTKLKDNVNKPFSDFLPVETCDSVSKEEIKEVKEIVVEPVFKNTNQQKRSSLNYIYNEISETGVISEENDDLPELNIEQEIEEPGLKKKKYSFWKVLLLIFTVLTFSFITFWAVKSNLDAKKEKIEKNKVFNKYISDSKVDSIKENINTKIDTVVPKDTLIQSNKTAEIVEYPIFITIMPGVNLMTLSKKYYGHKAFWVYIFIENKDVIPDPNNITVGKKIKISAPDPQKINSQSDVCLMKAGELQTKILNEYKN